MVLMRLSLVMVTMEVLEVPMEVLGDPPIIKVKHKVIMKNNDQAPGDPAGGPNGPRGLRVAVDLKSAMSQQ